MAKKYDGELNRHSDFTAAGPNGEPASGLAVQNYIKSIDSKKVGIGYTLPDGSAHLLFADTEDRDAFIEDPSRTDLIIDRFTLEPMYFMTYTLESPVYNYLFTGDTGNVIQYTFETTNKSGGIVAEPVNVVYTIIRGGTRQVINASYASGTEVEFNVDKYLLDGTNSVSVSITGQLSKIGVSFSVVYQVINLTLADTFDISRVYNPNGAVNSLEIPYAVSGQGQKTMQWYIDGVQVPLNISEDVIDDNTATRTKYISLAGLSQGCHSLQLRAGIQVGNETFYSEIHYREFIVSTGASDNPIITTATEIPSGLPVLTPQDSITISPTQYEPFTLRVGAFNPDGTYQNTVIADVDGSTVASISCTEGTESSVQLTLGATGEGVLSLSIGEYTREIDLYVNATTLDIHEITSDLEMNFTGEGKSNSSSDKNIWTDGVNSAELFGFNYNNTSGWVDGRLIVPSGAHIDFDLAPLANNPSNLGKTIEMEFRTVDVENDNATLIDLINSTTGAGIKLTATELSVASREGIDLKRRYKTDEDLRISVVINRKTGSTLSKLVQVYFNGILSMTQNFSDTDQFTAPNLLSVGGTGASIIIKQIRIYNTALDADSIVNNFILYRPTVADMLSAYERNDLYESGVSRFDLDKIAGFLPVMIITGDMTPIDTATDNKATTVVDIEYTNLQNPEYSFSMYHAQMRPQGTSSLTYPRKNLRLYTQKRDDTVVYDYRGNVVADKLYAFKPRAQRVNCWTLKADFAESSSTHNTGVARIWNDVMRLAQASGSLVEEYKQSENNYVLRTHAQQSAIDNEYPYDVRTTVDGFPIVVFHRRTEEDPLTFLGKYNFNNDKSTESVFGFTDIPGFDNTDMQCWEFRDSGYDLALFKTPSGRSYADEFDYYAADYEGRFMQVWESRYPDTKSPSYTHLRRLALWINSTEGASELDTDPASPTYNKLIPVEGAAYTEWSTNKGDYFDLPKLAAYYVYLIRFGAVDQTVKNAMLTTEDGEHWYFINYDNDTILGVRNDGLLKFGPEIDRQSPDPELGGYAYAGHDSVLWNNFEADPECMEMVRIIDSALYSAGLTYEEMIQMFNVDQAGKWAENIYNKDAVYKYIEPYLYQDKNYLGSLQGSRSDHRKWWISNRFSMYDALYANAAYENNAITMLIPGAPIGTTFNIVSGRDTYYGWGQNRIPVETGVHLALDESHQFTLSLNWQIGTPLRIYAPHFLKSLDLSPLMQYIGAANFNISAAYSSTLGSRMKTLNLGVTNPLTDLRRNNALESVSGLANIVTLENLNVAGFTAIRTMNLQTLVNLKVFKAFSSGLTSVTFANGAPLTTLELPVSLQTLTLNSLASLQASGITLEQNVAVESSDPDYGKRGMNIYHIDIRNCPNVSNSPNLLLNWLDDKLADDGDCTVYMDNVNWENISRENLTKICEFKNNGGNLTLIGQASIVNIGSEEFARYLAETFGPEVFNPSAQFYIQAPPAVYVMTDDAQYDTINSRYVVLEGNSAIFRAVVVGGELGGTAQFQIVSGSRTGVTLDLDTGVLSTTETGASSAVLEIRAVYTHQSTVLVGTCNVQVKQRTYPTISQITLTGPVEISVGTPNTYLIGYTSSDFDGNLVMSWSLSGDLSEYLDIVSSSNDQCVVALSGQPSIDAGSAVLTLTVNKLSGSSIGTKTATVGYQDQTIAISRAVNPYAMDVMYNNGLCASPDKMTKLEAALVSNNQLYPSGSSFSIFCQDYNFRNYCENFTEFQWFTGLTECRAYLFYSCYNLRTVVFPKTVATCYIRTYCLCSCRTIQEVTIQDNCVIEDRCIQGDSESVLHITLKGTVNVNFTSEGPFRTAKDGVLTAINTTNVYVENGCLYKANDEMVAISGEATSVVFKTGKALIGQLTMFTWNATSGSRVTSITLSEGVTNFLLTYANIRTLSIPSTAILSQNALRYLNNLESLEYSSGIDKTQVFYGPRDCPSLTSFTIPEGFTSIGSQAICNCPLNLSFPSSVTSFQLDSIEFVTSLNIGLNTTSSVSVSQHFFKGVGDVIIDPANTQFTKVSDNILVKVTHRNPTSQSNRTAIAVCWIKSGASIVTDSNVKCITNYALQAYAGSVVVPANIDDISYSGLIQAPGITSVTLQGPVMLGPGGTFQGMEGIPSGSEITVRVYQICGNPTGVFGGCGYERVTIIGESSSYFSIPTITYYQPFYGYEALRSIKYLTLKNGYLYSSWGAPTDRYLADNCTLDVEGVRLSGSTNYWFLSWDGKITRFIIRDTTPPTGNIAFADMFGGAKKCNEIYVPYGYGSTYRAASGWSDYANIIFELDQNGNIPE